MYFGGKDGSGVAQRLINQIPPHRVFVSAFLGDCAVLRRIWPAEMTVGIDRDPTNVERWQEWLSGREDTERRFALPGRLNLSLFCCDAVEWIRHAFGFYQVTPTFLAAGDDAPGTGAGSGGLVPPKESEIFVYCDPPYRLESRQDRRPRYACEMTEEDHRKLLATLNFVALQRKATVMIQHYPCDLYRAALGDWRTWTYRSRTRRGMATEQVWCSYPEPLSLHDTRYLGRDKRQREAIRRRRNRLRARLDRLHPLERQALLDGLA